MTVLILTCQEDVTADLVVAELHDRSVPLVRLDPADLPGQGALSADWIQGDFDGCLAVDERLLSLGALRSVWVRRPGTPAAHAPEPSSWLSSETEQALYGMLHCTRTRWMNHPHIAATARLKPWQLRLAYHSGFAVPPTVITTFPRVAQEFAKKYQDVVVKTVSGPPHTDPPVCLPTTLIGPDADFSDIAAAPTLLQKYVEKRADIRVTSVGRQVFAARKTALPGDVDGRYSDDGHSWEPSRTPDRILQSVHDYMQMAGLAYAAFDFAEDAEGVWWFLEANQGGQFGFIELETGQPLTAAVADWLAGPRPE